MSDYNVRWRVGETVVEEAVIAARSALQAARTFAKREDLAVEVSTRRPEGAVIVWSVLDGTGTSAGALLVI
jgi:hypothetical protein